MNVLILTPDSVGSTLLQRLITIYMQFYQYDKPVINLHELTIGIVKYYNTHFNQDVVGKPEDLKDWGYHQSLKEIVQILSSVDHYKTTRIAQYHFKARLDSIEDQVPFYKYMNENFYIISCRRHNVFEHALSACLVKITKKLNVYTPIEKLHDFFPLFQDGIEIDPNSLIQSLNAYRDYLTWCNDHFSVASYFYYEEHLPHIEDFILNLPIFPQKKKITWQDNFNIDFNSWNLCHYINSDLGALALNSPEDFSHYMRKYSELEFVNGYKDIAEPDWPAVNSVAEYQTLSKNIKFEIENKHQLISVAGKQVLTATKLKELLPAAHQQFLTQYDEDYQKSCHDISEMVSSRIMITPPPIKKYTLTEKRHIIKNYEHLLDVYNQWIEANPEVGLPLDLSTLNKFAQEEADRWNPETQLLLEKK